MAMKLPEQFKWLETIGTLPKIVTAAISHLGLKEIPGGKNNPEIMAMAKALGIEKIYLNDEISWCAVFINYLLFICGKPIDLNPKDKYDLMRAKRVASSYPAVPVSDIRLGDIVVINRTGGGHVFIAIGITDKGTVWGLGGNQSNSVTFAEFDITRVSYVKRYYATGIPASAKEYKINSKGLKDISET